MFQVYTGPAILQSEYAASVRLFATAPPATKATEGGARPPSKGDGEKNTRVPLY